MEFNKHKRLQNSSLQFTLELYVINPITVLFWNSSCLITLEERVTFYRWKECLSAQNTWWTNNLWFCVWHFKLRFSTPSFTSESDFVTQNVWNLTRFCSKFYYREIFYFCTSKNALTYITNTTIGFDMIFGFCFKTEVNLPV